MEKKSKKNTEQGKPQPPKENPHDGHRARMRARFYETGLDGFASHEVLEFLLFFAQPRGNTNGTAHALIERFGSLAGVLEASYDELKSVPRIGDASATLISLMPRLFRRYSKEKEESLGTYDSISKLNAYAKSLFVGATDEQVYLMLFDNSLHILDCTLLAHGTVNQVSFMTRRIVEKAIEKHASCVVIAHNHPNGLALPSPEDRQMTETIEQALQLIELPLLEHIIVAGASCLPMIYHDRGTDRPLPAAGSFGANFFKAFYELKPSEEA